MNPESTTEILNAIGSVGFPIVACGALFWMINTTMKELTSTLENLSDTIDELRIQARDRKDA